MGGGCGDQLNPAFILQLFDCSWYILIKLNQKVTTYVPIKGLIIRSQLRQIPSAIRAVITLISTGTGFTFLQIINKF
jgi:hypothetical protein